MYGEGAMRMNKATNFIILAARRAQKIWGLSDAAVAECLERATNAESGRFMSNMETNDALRPGSSKSVPERPDDEVAKTM